MPTRNYHVLIAIVLVLAICASFMNVRSARADGENPTEPPPPTQVATEPPVESTPAPVEATATPLAEALTQVPDNTEVVVLDQEGNSVPLTSQDATEIAAGTDPMWCPEGVLPGGPGCSSSYSTISALINNMVSNTAFYEQDGVIYFTANPGSGTFNLSPTTLTGDFDALKNHNLRLQGGWNGDTVSPTISGQSDFSNHPITIGSSTNPWVGNIVINSITFTGASQASLTVYTTTGNITLSDVDVNNQAGGHNTAILDSASGNIAVSNGTFDGNNTNSAGFSATTGGAVTVSDSSFTENKKSGAASNSNGATLSAPTVTLTNVTASGNDGNGVSIDNASLVTLNSVVASSNGTNPPGPANNIGSGVFINGVAGSNVFIDHGEFNSNKNYGIELANPANTTIHIQHVPACTGDLSGCSNGTFATDTTAPTLSLPADITTNAAGPSGAVVTYTASATDDLDPSVSVACVPPSGSTFSIGVTTVNCSASDTAGNIALGSFQVTVVDTTVPPTPTPSPVPSPAPSPAPASTGSESGSLHSSALIIPVTGGKIIALGCDSAFWAFGVRLSFTNLCDYQATLDNVNLPDLPGALPDGYSFVMGLNLSILRGNQALEQLPEGTSIQLAFPLLGNSPDQFAVLSWDGSAWTEVPPQSSSDPGFYQVTTTEQTGIFVLVKK